MSRQKSRDNFFNKMFKGGNVYCCWCATRLFKKTATLEHLMPKALGGSNRQSNYLLACAPCNNQRGRDSWQGMINYRRNNFRHKLHLQMDDIEYIRSYLRAPNNKLKLEILQE